MESEIYAKILNISELPDYLNQVENRIIEAISGANSHIKKPINRLLEGLNKPKRAFLVIAAAQSQGGVVDDTVISCAAAIELANMGVSVHDDIMDNADKRWGVSSVNAKEGVGQALLVGDYLLALAIDQARAHSSEASKVIIDSITTMVNGQSQETADRYNIDRSVDSYLDSIRMKTCSLTAAACRLGGLCAELDQEKIDSLSAYGESVGMMFQLLDDLLDLLSTEEFFGKPVDSDVREGIYTFPVLLALKGQRKNHIKAMLKELPRGRTAPPELLNLLRSSGSIQDTIQEIRSQNDNAAKALINFETNKIVDGLSRLPADSFDLALEKLAVRL